MNPNYFITLKWPDSWQPTIHQGPIILTKTIKEYHSRLHYAYFDTFGAEIGRLCSPKLVFKVPQEIEFYGILLQIGDRKDVVCLRVHGKKSSSQCAAISAMLDPQDRAFVLIQVLYKEWMRATIFKSAETVYLIFFCYLGQSRRRLWFRWHY